MIRDLEAKVIVHAASGIKTVVASLSIEKQSFSRWATTTIVIMILEEINLFFQ